MSFYPTGQFPAYRPRRLRLNAILREMIQGVELEAKHLILPLFVRAGSGVRRPVPSLPGVFQFSPDEVATETQTAWDLGIRAILLFGIPDQKDKAGSQAYATTGIVQETVRLVKKQVPGILVITDVCLCEFTSHGHCGLIAEGDDSGRVLNDPSLELLAKTAVSQAEAGADIVAPSDMMDGRIGAIRKALDRNELQNVSIMSYAAKFASSYYGPFREAAESSPKFGDRRSYQMDPANADEAMREVAMDIEEGADLVMVKPALAYLDLVHRVKTTFRYPTVAYAVSGEYAMIKAAAAQGWINERAITLETLLCMRRAGADQIITYSALDAARWLRSG
jgi:porphobilinogen synthase